MDSPVDTRSCRIAGRVSARPVPHGHAAGCTNRQQNAHITELRVVLYPWHPWYGRSVLVFGAMTKGERGALFSCALDDHSRPVEVPEWMFDAALCSQTSRVTTPSQIALFHAQSMVPSWLSLPAEVREQAVKLLARLLRQHQKARFVVRYPGER